jgi:hypothetical protein
VSTPVGAFRPGLLVNGSLTFVDGTQGHGLISSWLIPQIGSDGHIQRILAGELTIGGSWTVAARSSPRRPLFDARLGPSADRPL